MNTQLSMKSIFKLIFGLIGLMIMLICAFKMITTVGANEIVIKQGVWGGLEVWSDPGPHWQNFGRLTRYQKSDQLWFSSKMDEGKKIDESIRVRFNEGGHGNVSGSLRYFLPTNPDKMIALHTTYHSMEAIHDQLIRQVVNKGVYMSGPLMSSRESYAEKRADLISFISDQIAYGVYRTEHKQTETTDPLTGQKKTIDYVEPKINPAFANSIEREEESPIQKYGITVNNITINGIDYESMVEDQIKKQQEAMMSVQQAIINAKKAEQDAITVEKQGEAEAAKAKWAQEVEKAKAVTIAEQEKAVAVTEATKDKEVAELALQTARLNAQQTLATARAEADAKKMQMQANNQLELRLDAWKEVAIHQADAIGAQRQVPDIQMGGGGTSSSAVGTQQLMEMLAAKAARDLGVSPQPK